MKPRSPYTLRLSESQRAAYQAAADREGVPLSRWIRAQLDELAGHVEPSPATSSPVPSAQLVLGVWGLSPHASQAAPAAPQQASNDEPAGPVPLDANGLDHGAAERGLGERDTPVSRSSFL